MATDSLDPCGIYAGTTTGQIFYSRDNGDNWELMVEYLPNFLQWLPELRIEAAESAEAFAAAD